MSSRAVRRRWRRLLGLLTVAASIAVSTAAEVHGTASSVDIGSGARGLKLCHDSSGEAVIFEDEPWTVEHGIVGGWNRRHLVFVARQVERPRCANLMSGYQLYPFDSSQAFSHNVMITEQERLAGSLGSEWSGYQVE